MIKELTHKNKLLTAQIGEYKVLVSNLNQRVSELEAENEGLRQKGSASESKLHTIMEEMSNMEPTVSSCSRAEDRCALELSEVVQEQLMEP